MSANPAESNKKKGQSEVFEAGGIVFAGNQVLLRLNSAGHWLFPKGHLEAGESPVQAAVREVAEETGIEAHPVAELGEEEYDLSGEHYRVLYFLMRKTGKMPFWKEHEDKDAFLLSPEDALERLTFEGGRRLLRKAMGMAGAQM